MRREEKQRVREVVRAINNGLATELPDGVDEAALLLGLTYCITKVCVEGSISRAELNEMMDDGYTVHESTAAMRRGND